MSTIGNTSEAATLIMAFRVLDLEEIYELSGEEGRARALCFARDVVRAEFPGHRSFGLEDAIGVVGAPPFEEFLRRGGAVIDIVERVRRDPRSASPAIRIRLELAEFSANEKVEGEGVLRKLRPAPARLSGSSLPPAEPAMPGAQRVTRAEFDRLISKGSYSVVALAIVDRVDQRATDPLRLSLLASALDDVLVASLPKQQCFFSRMMGLPGFNIVALPPGSDRGAQDLLRHIEIAFAERSLAMGFPREFIAYGATVPALDRQGIPERVQAAISSCREVLRNSSRYDDCPLLLAASATAITKSMANPPVHALELVRGFELLVRWLLAIALVQLAELTPQGLRTISALVTLARPLPDGTAVVLLRQVLKQLRELDRSLLVSPGIFDYLDSDVDGRQKLIDFIQEFLARRNYLIHQYGALADVNAVAYARPRECLLNALTRYSRCEMGTPVLVRTVDNVPPWGCVYKVCVLTGNTGNLVPHWLQSAQTWQSQGIYLVDRPRDRSVRLDPLVVYGAGDGVLAPSMHLLQHHCDGSPVYSDPLNGTESSNLSTEYEWAFRRWAGLD